MLTDNRADSIVIHVHHQRRPYPATPCMHSIYTGHGPMDPSHVCQRASERVSISSPSGSPPGSNGPFRNLETARQVLVGAHGIERQRYGVKGTLRPHNRHQSRRQAPGMQSEGTTDGMRHWSVLQPRVCTCGNV